MDSVALGKSHKLGFAFPTIWQGDWHFSAARSNGASPGPGCLRLGKAGLPTGFR